MEKQILYIHQFQKKYELGRYTHKASVAKLKEQVAFAALNDIGLTTTIEPNKKCTSFKKSAQRLLNKEIIDLPDERLEAITYYLRNLKLIVQIKPK